MKTKLIISLLLISLPTFASKIKSPKCSELTNIAGRYTPQYLAVVDGYDNAGKEISSEIDIGGIVTDSKNLKQECLKQKTAKIESVRRQMTNVANSIGNANSKLDLKKAKCEDFLAWGEEIQPVAAFWVAGHSKTGKVKNGAVDEEFLERPVATLIEDCKAEPTASFYDKTKAWFKKHI